MTNLSFLNPEDRTNPITNKQYASILEKRIEEYRATKEWVRRMDILTQKVWGNLTFIQSAVILEILKGTTQPYLVADALGQESQTITGVVDRLEREGYLVRVRDLKDRRAVRLEVTKHFFEYIGSKKKFTRTLNAMAKYI